MFCVGTESRGLRLEDPARVTCSRFWYSTTVAVARGAADRAPSLPRRRCRPRTSSARF
jgi:hypothetical protein